MKSRSEKIYRDRWPDVTRVWAGHLLDEMGLEWGFWTQKKLMGRREKLAVVLTCMRLRLRHNFSCDEIAALFNLKRTGVYPYVLRGDALLEADEMLWRNIVNLEGRDAPYHVISSFGKLWCDLFDEENPNQLAALN